MSLDFIDRTTELLGAVLCLLSIILFLAGVGVVRIMQLFLVQPGKLTIQISLAFATVGFILLIVEIPRFSSQETIEPATTEVATFPTIATMPTQTTAPPTPAMTNTPFEPPATPTESPTPEIPTPTETPTSAPTIIPVTGSQKVRWGPTAGQPPGICLDSCHIQERFMPWEALKTEVELKLLPQITTIPAGCIVRVQNLEGQKDWVVAIISPSGTEVGNIWFGPDPNNNWQFDGLIRVGTPKPLEVWMTFRRMSDATYERIVTDI